MDEVGSSIFHNNLTFCLGANREKFSSVLDKKK